MNLADRSVLVTGASYGIGAAIARAAAQAGARRVILMARTQPALEQVAADVRAAGSAAAAYAVDLTDHAAVERVAGEITATFGPPDVVVNNAGIGRWLFVEETAPAEAVAMMGAPYFAAFFVTRAFLPAMLERRSGQIVNINSPAALVAWPGSAAYTAARAALRGFTEALRADLAGTGVKVTSVIAGKVSSTYWQHNPGAEERAPWIARAIPTLSPEQVGAATVRAVERDAREIVIPGMLKLFYQVNRVAPGLVRWLVVATGARRGARG